ncbi:MAG: hypothetical protein R2729_05705 [Bryobacteraceae bacterium]
MSYRIRKEGIFSDLTDADLASLYERRRIVEDLITALERYERNVRLLREQPSATPPQAA